MQQAKTRMGLWINHRKAVVVALASDGRETTTTILSNVEKQPGRLDGKRSTARYEWLQVQADDSRQNRFTAQIDVYYDTVVAHVRDADTVLVFGPGEAKGEFRKRMEKAGLSGHIEEVEAADKMTDRQIAAKVRQHFQGDQAKGRSAARTRRGARQRSGVADGE